MNFSSVSYHTMTPNLSVYQAAKAAVIGKVVATANGKPVGEAPLVAQADVERSGLLLRGWQHLLQLIGK